VVGITFKTSCFSTLVHAVEIFDASTGGIEVQQSAHSLMLSKVMFTGLEDGSSETPDYALKLNSVANSAAVTVIGCNFDMHRVTKIVDVVNGSTDMTSLCFIGNYIEVRDDNSATHCIHIQEGSGFHFAGNRIIFNPDATAGTPPDYAIKVESGANAVAVIGNYFSGFATACVRMESGASDLFMASNNLGSISAVSDANTTSSSIHVTAGVATGRFKVNTAASAVNDAPRLDQFQGSATAAQLASAAHSINTSGKFTGRLVWDSTNNRLARAAGTGTTSAWQYVDASGSITPV